MLPDGSECPRWRRHTGRRHVDSDRLAGQSFCQPNCRRAREGRPTGQGLPDGSAPWFACRHTGRLAPKSGDPCITCHSQIAHDLTTCTIVRVNEVTTPRCRRTGQRVRDSAATQVGWLVTVTARRPSHSVIRAAERTIRAFQHAGQKLRTLEREADLKGSFHLLLQETTP